MLIMTEKKLPVSVSAVIISIYKTDIPILLYIQINRGCEKLTSLKIVLPISR